VVSRARGLAHRVGLRSNDTCAYRDRIAGTGACGHVLPFATGGTGNDSAAPALTRRDANSSPPSRPDVTTSHPVVVGPTCASSTPIELPPRIPRANAFGGRISTIGRATSPTAFSVPSTAAPFPESSPYMESTTPTSTSSGAEAPPPSVNTTGLSDGRKKGLAYNYASLTDLFAGKGMSWAYNWAADPSGPIVLGAEYVPMLWGLDKSTSWAKDVESAFSGGSRHALSFNEPDLAIQANIEPSLAAAKHIEYMNPLADRMSIGSPAITNGNQESPPMGTTWLRQFLQHCQGACRIDFVAFHWYDSASNFAYFQQHVWDVINATQAANVDRVWLTEFGASGSDDEVASFLRKAIPFLDSTDAVERYAYFMCGDGLLVNADAISSPIGEAYAGG
jgi:hypothetical protein